MAECFGLSGLKGHRTGGSVHFIVNNQIGFTTYPRYSRSSPYPSDVAKMVEAPIFHVNGDDPEAVVFAAKVAIEFRQKFHKPVVIDMFCYRRFGHNEGDEPALHPAAHVPQDPRPHDRRWSSTPPLDRRGRDPAGRGRRDEGRPGRASSRSSSRPARPSSPTRPTGSTARWAGLKAIRADEDDPRRGETGVPARGAEGDRPRRSPRRRPGFNVHRTIQRFLDNRRKAVETGQGIDWATAEALAFGTLLLDEGIPVRLSGQDCERGTFSQRHSVLIDQETEERYTPLNNIARRPGALRGHQLDALGRGGARLRIRLLAGRAQRADALGSAVRRLRQRRAGGVRPVHLVGRAQMAAHVAASSACCRMATRARGRSTPPPASSASCRCAPRTTCRSPTARRRRTISTSCAASSTATSASRSS